jgi:hypothetical protein
MVRMLSSRDNNRETQPERERGLEHLQLLLLPTAAAAALEQVPSLVSTLHSTGWVICYGLSSVSLYIAIALA